MMCTHNINQLKTASDIYLADKEGKYKAQNYSLQYAVYIKCGIIARILLYSNVAISELKFNVKLVKKAMSMNSYCG